MPPKRKNRSVNDQNESQSISTEGTSSLPTRNDNNSENSKNFIIQINNFDGDPSLVHHFFEQIQDLKEINNWSERQSILFLKSKLQGQALTYFLNSPHLKKAKLLSEIHDDFSNFFSPASFSTSIIELNAMAPTHGENYKNFAHRLDVAVGKIYNNLPKDNLDQIKFVKFISVIPSEIRLQIMQNNITNYNEAVQRAQQLQDLTIFDSKLSQNTEPEIFKRYSEQINSLQKQIEHLTSSKEKSASSSSNQINNLQSMECASCRNKRSNQNCNSNYHHQKKYSYKSHKYGFKNQPYQNPRKQGRRYQQFPNASNQDSRTSYRNIGANCFRYLNATRKQSLNVEARPYQPLN